MTNWQVELHPLANDEVKAMSVDIQAKLTRIVGMIESYGLQAVGMPYVRPIEGKLWEMRMKGQDNIGRALYVALQGRRVVILHGFIKKTQETPRRAIELAYQRLQDIET